MFTTNRIVCAISLYLFLALPLAAQNSGEVPGILARVAAKTEDSKGSVAIKDPLPVPIPEICTPDCPFTNWDGPYEINPLSVGGCNVKVRYWYRVDCNGNYDIQISRWNTLGGVCIADKVQLAGLIEIALLQRNEMNWPPYNEGGCNYAVRAVRASCYQIEFPSGDIIPCFQNNCCQSQYRICIVKGERVVTKTGQNSVENTCNVDFGCRFYCPAN